MKFIHIVSGEVDRLETVSLIALAGRSSIYFPRLVSVPKGPFSINHLKIVLESLSQSPLLRVVDNPDSIVQTLEGEVAQYKKWLFVFRPLQREKTAPVDIKYNSALSEECVAVGAHFGFVL